MARRWTEKEENTYRSELKFLYVVKNKTIDEISDILGIAPQTVFQRLQRLDIKSQPELKKNYQNKRLDVFIPKKNSAELAEFFGIMLGDGNLSHFQTAVTLGNKEAYYAKYVAELMEDIFRVSARICIRKKGYRDVYIGSVEITNWLLKEGLVFNKVKAQVDVPKWIFSKPIYMKRFLRGFFDTDGSVYKLKYGIQLSFTNRSKPLLVSLQKALFALGYKASLESVYKIYLTRRKDLENFFKEIRPQNPKHLKRYKLFVKNAPVV